MTDESAIKHPIGVNEARPQQSVGLGAWTWVLGYAAILSTMSVLKFRLWIANGLDLGLYEQGLWLIVHRGFDAASTYLGYSALAHGGSWMLVPLSLLYAVGGVGLVLVVQALSLGFGFFMVLELARVAGLTGKRIQWIAISLLIYPTVLGVNLYDFHPEVLLVPLLFWAILAAQRAKWLQFLGASLLACAASDLAPLLLLGVGLVLSVRRRPIAAAITIVASLALGIIDSNVLIPSLAHIPNLVWSQYFPTLGISFSAGLMLLARDPSLLVRWVVDARSWEYIGFMVVGPMYLSWILGGRRLSPWWIPVALLLEANLVSGIPLHTSPFNQYAVPAVPFVFAAVLDQLSGTVEQDTRSFASAMAIPVLFLLAFVWQQHRTFWRTIPTEAQGLVQATSVIPANAPVVAQNFAIAHLSDRAQAWLPSHLMVSTVPKGTFVLLDTATSTGTTPPAVLSAVAAAVHAPGAAVAIWTGGPVTLWKLKVPVGPLSEGSR